MSHFDDLKFSRFAIIKEKAKLEIVKMALERLWNDSAATKTSK